MHNVYLIARREYLERIRTRAFTVMTILVPLLMLGFTVVPSLMADRPAGTKRVVIVSSDRQTADLIRQQLEKARAPQSERDENNKTQALPQRGMPQTPRYNIELDTDTSADHRAELTDRVKRRFLDGVIWAPAEALQARRISYITRDTAVLIDKFQIQTSIEDALQHSLLTSRGLNEAEIKDFQKPVKLDVQGASGGAPKDVRASLLSLIFLTTVLYVSVLMYGINVMNAVLEEKNSRVMEVMLATTDSRNLMAGKIAGVGAVGLTQIGIWVLAGLIFSSSTLIAAGPQLKNLISISAIVFFAVFFVLGYGLYSTLYAAIGAMVNSQQEGQQLQQLVALPLALSFIFIFTVIQYPNSPIAVAASFFPLTAPLMMFARIVLETPPWWQIALSIGLLLATTYGVVLVCARIYRVGILMYGKRPTLPEIMKWLRYA
jgi:ABC-2 type transport system permease protein